MDARADAKLSSPLEGKRLHERPHTLESFATVHDYKGILMNRAYLS